MLTTTMTTTATASSSKGKGKAPASSSSSSASSSLNGLMLSPDKAAIHRIATTALQSRSVTIDKLDGYIYRTYRLHTSSEQFFYILRTRPSPNVRLLRHEEGWFQAEAGALNALTKRVDLSVPRLIEASTSRATPLGTPYLISGPFAGAILSDIEPSLSRQALASIDQSLGAYVRRLCALPGGPQFGFLRQAQGYPGFDSWTRAFAFLIESVIRDGEDVGIKLPYEEIRDLVGAHRAALDRIVIPRLTLLELASDRNVVVDTQKNRVSGVLDFSSAIWGDPFMSDAFYKPTTSFAEGFGKLPNSTPDERVRQYLYVLYHALLAIVRHSYRPSKNDDEKDARRTMQTAMRQLATAAGK